MTPQRWQQIKDIFHAALESPADERSAFLDQACGGDAELRSEVERLLTQHAETGGFMETAGNEDVLGLSPSLVAQHEHATSSAAQETVGVSPLTSAGATASLPDSAGERPGTRIGRYKLLQLIGEGGFGSVYRAEQIEPVRRTVALKLIKLGMDTRQVIARFEAERQALAVMDHPHVAKVFDAGATDTGRPYFVMEYVQGVPITEHCDRHKLSVRERLELFIQVCEAVQHAHQKGLIHRDLKPSNILVSDELQIADCRLQIDDRVNTPHKSAIGNRQSAIPKVIDFGVAKAVSRSLTDNAAHTEQGQLIGTPAYMSPEQADPTAQDIDTRSDIYSLGVLLYELLTGTLPFDPTTLRGAGFVELVRMIREVEPRKPSTRLQSMSPDGSDCQLPMADCRLESDVAAENRKSEIGHRKSSVLDIAHQRRTDPRALARTIRGDLDWITMKALEKDRTRRYASASDFAADIRRHLAYEPVTAGPPGKLYRLRKLMRRNAGVVAASGAVAAALVLGAAAATYGLIRARVDRDAAVASREAEAVQRTRAEARAKETQQVADFQARLLRDIDVEAMGRGLVSALRRQVQAGLERQYVGEWPNRRKRTDDEVQAALIAFEEAADPGNPTDAARNILDEYVLERAVAAIEREFDQLPLVEAAVREAIGETYQSLGLYDAAQPHLRRALELREQTHGHVHADVARSLDGLGQLLHATGDYAVAEPFYREALAVYRQLFGNEHRSVAASSGNLAVLLQAKGEYAAAELLFRETLAINRKLLGTEQPEVATSLDNLAVLLQARGDHDGAEPLMREALALRQRLLGDQHLDVATSLSNVAQLLWEKSDYAEAEPLLREALAVHRKLLGDEHPQVAASLNNLAGLLKTRGDYLAAEPLFREALALRRKLLGDKHPAVGTSLNNLAGLLKDKGDYAAAELLMREALALRRRLLGDEHPQVATSLSNLAWSLKARGEYAGAEPLLREALAIKRKLVGTEHPDVAVIVNSLADLLYAKGDSAAAEPLFREALAMKRKLLGDEHPDVAASMNSLAGLLQARGDYAAAESLFRDALAIYRERLGDQHAYVAIGLNNLARLLQAKGDYAAAEPLFREALAMNRVVLEPGHPNIATSLNNLARLLQARGDSAAAEPLLREALAILRQRFGDQHPHAMAAASSLAALLVQRGDYAAAEPLLLDGYRGVAEHPRASVQRRKEIMEAIVKLYDSWHASAPGRGYDEQAATWRAELAGWQASTQPAAATPSEVPGP